MHGFEPMNPNRGARVQAVNIAIGEGGATMLEFLVPLLLIVIAVELGVIISKLDALAKTR